MKMKAAVCTRRRKLSVEEIDIADPGPNEVRVKIAASGLCHTDWETMHGYQPVNLPAVIGHEGAGIVESIGPGVTARQSRRPRGVLVESKLRSLLLL